MFYLPYLDWNWCLHDLSSQMTYCISWSFVCTYSVSPLTSEKDFIFPSVLYEFLYLCGIILLKLSTVKPDSTGINVPFFYPDSISGTLPHPKNYQEKIDQYRTKVAQNNTTFFFIATLRSWGGR